MLARVEANSSIIDITLCSVLYCMDSNFKKVREVVEGTIVSARISMDPWVPSQTSITVKPGVFVKAATIDLLSVKVAIKGIVADLRKVVFLLIIRDGRVLVQLISSWKVVD